MLEQPTELNWLYLDINSYFATIEQQVNPDLRKKPVAVVPLLSDSTCAIAASYEAKLYGIKTGTKIYEAKRLCSELICIQAKHKLYTEYHKLIFAEINKLLYIDYIYSIDEGTGKLTGKYKNKHHAIILANDIKSAIKQNIGEYITCSIGIAPNKFLAKIAAEMQKPDGLTIIEPKDIPSKLYDLRLKDIPGIGRKTLKRLNASGINSVQHLYTCSSNHLQTIWGSVYGKKYWYLLRGYDLPEYATQKKVISHSKILAPNSRTIQIARNIAIELAIKASKRLRKANLYATYIGLYIKTINKITYKSYVKITPSCDNMTISKQMLNSWEKLISQNNISSLYYIAISLSGLIEKPHQMTFNELGQNSKNQSRDYELSKTMDAINNKYGKTIIHIGLLSTEDKTPIAFGYIP